MSRKLFIITGLMILALVGLLAMLFHWGRQSIQLREEIFTDQVQTSVDRLINGMEENYFCFDLHSEASLPKLDSFALPNPGEAGGVSSLPLRYTDREGALRSMDQLPIMGPAHLQIQLHFEFKDIPEFRADSTLTPFEKYIRDVYDQYLVDEKGNRLIDTTSFDSLLLSCVTPLYPEGEIAYLVKKNENDQVLYSSNIQAEAEIPSPDVVSYIFSNDLVLPELRLEMLVTNKSGLYSTERLIIYLGAALLAIICGILIFYFIRIQLKQKKVLKLQRDFIHGMTHEFNTPIANIRLAAQNLIRSSDEKLRKTGEILQEEGRKLETGINLVLTTALIEKEELMLKYEGIDVKDLLERTVKRNSTGLRSFGIKVSLDVPTEELISQGDVFHLENVLQNLINNVKKHSRADELKISTSRINGHVSIHFKDNGKGIPEADRERIFGKFERIGNMNQKNGYGLGLYYSKMILEMHGGNIYYSSNGHKGAEFTIELPL